MSKQIKDDDKKEVSFTRIPAVSANILLISQLRHAMNNPEHLLLNNSLLSSFCTLVTSTFSLSPDNMADARRIPGWVVSLSDLYKFLVSIHTSISDNKLGAEQAGLMRIYKNYVLAIHAISHYVSVYDKSVPRSYVQHAMEVVALAVTWKPEQLGEKAQVLWEKTFTEGKSRTMLAITHVMKLSAKDKREEGIAQSSTVEEFLTLEQGSAASVWKGATKKRSEVPSSVLFNPYRDVVNLGSLDDLLSGADPTSYESIAEGLSKSVWDQVRSHPEAGGMTTSVGEDFTIENDGRYFYSLDKEHMDEMSDFPLAVLVASGKFPPSTDLEETVRVEAWSRGIIEDISLDEDAESKSYLEGLVSAWSVQMKLRRMGINKELLIALLAWSILEVEAHNKPLGKEEEKISSKEEEVEGANMDKQTTA